MKYDLEHHPHFCLLKMSNKHNSSKKMWIIWLIFLMCPQTFHERFIHKFHTAKLYLTNDLLAFKKSAGWTLNVTVKWTILSFTSHPHPNSIQKGTGKGIERTGSNRYAPIRNKWTLAECNRNYLLVKLFTVSENCLSLVYLHHQRKMSAGNHEALFASWMLQRIQEHQNNQTIVDWIQSHPASSNSSSNQLIMWFSELNGVLKDLLPDLDRGLSGLWWYLAV